MSARRAPDRLRAGEFPVREATGERLGARGRDREPIDAVGRSREGQSDGRRRQPDDPEREPSGDAVANGDADLRRRLAEKRRKRAERSGRRAEAFAALALRVSGWRVVAMRHRGPGGEVDLVARRGDLVVMVEVKARATLRGAADAVSPSAWRRIEAAGDDWLMRQREAARLSIRYDIVWVPTPLRPWRWPRRIEGAWQP